MLAKLEGPVNYIVLLSCSVGIRHWVPAGFRTCWVNHAIRQSSRTSKTPQMRRLWKRLRMVSYLHLAVSRTGDALTKPVLSWNVENACCCQSQFVCAANVPTCKKHPLHPLHPLSIVFIAPRVGLLLPQTDLSAVKKSNPSKPPSGTPSEELSGRCAREIVIKFIKDLNLWVETCTQRNTKTYGRVASHQPC